MATMVMDGDGHKWWLSAPHLEKKKEKTKNRLKAKV
jgi:hypothetical protein